MTAMAALLLLTSGPERCEAVHCSCVANIVCLFYGIATLFHLSHGDDMMSEMRRKREPALFIDSRDL